MIIRLTVILVRFSIFKHIVDFEDESVEYNLAYVQWYKPVKTSKIRYYLLLMMMKKLIMSNYRKTNFILMVVTVLFQYKIFFADLYLISNRQDAIEYLAINPINRKFHIR